MSQIVSIRLHLSFRLFLLFALLGVFILFSPTKVADAVFCDSGYCNPDVEDACFYQGFDCDGVCVLDQERGTWGCGGDGVIPAYTCSMPIERCETQPPPPSSSSPPPPGFVNLNFTVRDACSSSGISGATVQVDRDFGNGTTRTTDGGGFASFGVARNTSNIGWSVSAGGYNNGSGTASTNTLDVNVPVSLNRTAGCGGGPPPPPPPPPPPGVTCSLSFSPSTIDEGLSSTAIWNTNDADGSIPYSCNGSGIPSPGTLGGASGSTPVTPTNSQTCIITVRNSSGATGQCQGSITVEELITIPPPPPPPTCAGSGSGATPDNYNVTVGSGNIHPIYVNGVQNADSVRVAVWSDFNGQDAGDFRWYTAVYEGSNRWRADVNLNNHRAGSPNYGAFSAHAYMNGPGGNDVFCDTANFTRVVPPPTNLTLSCPAPGTTVTASWTAPAGFNTFYLRAGIGANNMSPPYAAYSDAVVGSSFTFLSTAGQTYYVWINTRDPVTGVWSPELVAANITCGAAAPPPSSPPPPPPSSPPPPPPGAPTVSISASPNPVNYNTASTISWNSNNTASCSVPGIGTGRTGSGSTGPLTSNRTYTATCIGLDESSISRSVTVVVSPPTLTISADQTSVNYGGSTTIRWNSNNAGSCTASGDWSGSKALSGSQSTGALNQTRTFTYTLTCSGNGSITRSATVTVNSPPAPTVDLRCNDSQSCGSVTYGAARTLSWSITNGAPTTSCSASNAWSGTKASSGSESTGAITSDRTWTIQCTGPGGSGPTDSVSATVPSPDADIRCNDSNGPCNLSWGASSLIEWCGNNASVCANSSSCSVTRSGSAWANGTSGSRSTGALLVPGSQTYQLTCLGDGSANDSVQITVANPIPTTSNVSVPMPNYCVSGPTATVCWSYSDPSGSPQLP